MTIENPTSALNPVQRQELQAATNPIDSAIGARAELDQIAQRQSALTARMRAATVTYKDHSTVSGNVPDDVAAEIRRAAESELATVETEIRRDLVPITARSQQITRQLTEASEEPSLASIDPDVLDAANKYAPLLRAQLADARLDAIQKRLNAARIRDDAAELLALATVLKPILSERDKDSLSIDDERAFYAIGDQLREIGSRYRDTSLDGHIERASKVSRELVDFDNEIVRNRTERTGDEDPYNFLGK